MNRIFKVTGLQFHDYDEIRDELTTGQSVQLERMLNNEFDINAIRVMYGDKQIGWIPKHENTQLALLLDEGKEYTARVYEHVTTFTRSRPMGLFVEVEVL